MSPYIYIPPRIHESQARGIIKEANRMITVGTVVMVNGYMSNGLDTHCAIVTRVFSPKCVNLILMPDNGTPLPMTSVAFFESRKEADEYRAAMGAEKRGLFLTAWR